MIVNAELEPVVGLTCQGCGNRCITCIFDLLAVLKELIPCSICSGDLDACCFADCLIYEKAFPVAIEGNGIFHTVCRGCGNHIVLHVCRIVRILLADRVDGDYFSGLHKGIGVVAVEVEQHIRLGTGLKISNYSGLHGLIRCGGGIADGISGGCLPILDHVLIIFHVGFRSGKGGCHIQSHSICHGSHGYGCCTNSC